MQPTGREVRLFRLNLVQLLQAFIAKNRHIFKLIHHLPNRFCNRFLFRCILDRFFFYRFRSDSVGRCSRLSNNFCRSCRCWWCFRRCVRCHFWNSLDFSFLFCLHNWFLFGSVRHDAVIQIMKNCKELRWVPHSAGAIKKTCYTLHSMA